MITLTFAGYTVQFVHFSGMTTPRADPSYAVEHTANGTPTRYGTSHLPKSIWSIQALIDNDQADTLRRLYASYRANPGNITVDDLTWPFVEPSPRSRALAAGATEADDGTTTAYFARWNAEITELELTQDGRVWEVGIAMIETEATTP